MPPLNQALFDQLERVFGRVRISNEGQARISNRTRDVRRADMREIDRPIQSGEEYMVCCPRCNDTRFRLYINHTFGTRNESGGRNKGLLVCYNEDCYRDAVDRDLLYEQLCSTGTPLAQAVVAKGRTLAKAAVMTLPGDVIRLDKLPIEHPACQYLAGRFYDPQRLGRFYGVGYCTNSHFTLARGRIIVPVKHEGKLYGWQARYVGDVDWKSSNLPKWWTAPNMSRSLLLYNLHNAVRYTTGVIVEGAGDVWSVGPMAVACFGATMTAYQRRLFVAAFSRHSGVIMFDPDVMKHEGKRKRYDELFRELRREFPPGKFCRVVLPEGTDPGSLDRSFVRRYIEAEAAKQMCTVSWSLRK